MMNLMIHIVFMIILSILGLLSILYMYVSLRNILIYFANFNLERAECCSWKSCGLYDHDDSDAPSRDCLSPMVSPIEFDRRCLNDEQRGCWHSMRIKEITVPRKAAEDYQKEWLARYTTFNDIQIWWRMIAILLALTVWYLGVLNLDDIVKRFIK